MTEKHSRSLPGNVNGAYGETKTFLMAMLTFVLSLSLFCR